MGFIKDLGEIAGSIAGAVIGGPVYLAGTIFDSELLKDIGDGAYHVTARTGRLLGNATEGVVEVVEGTVNDNKEQQKQGINKVIDSDATYAKGMIRGVGKLAETGIETTKAICDGDTDKLIKCGKEIIKVAAVGTLAIGVMDVVDGIVDMDIDGGHDTHADFSYGENAPQYWVEAPHTAAGGYFRTMPDNDITNNISYKG